MARETERIVVSDDGLSLPVIEVLTGRGAIFGKSGSGKSNTASVVVEELLERGFPVLIIDIEGEYATLKDRYDVVHVGDGDQYDYGLFETDPGKIVDFCLDQHRPVVIDISEILEIERAEVTIRDTLQLLFSREKHENKPFLVLVEEVHEFLPQQGGLDDLGEMLIRIAKRGRKRGLGLLGMSQRPASVDKNFITQCDWLVFHRLTWENDTRVVKSILGSDYAEDVKELRTGSAFLMADWEDAVRQVTFRRKRTDDAGDTPSLSPSQRRDLTSPTDESPTSDPESAADAAPESESDAETAATEPDEASAAESTTDSEAAVTPLEADPPTVLVDRTEEAEPEPVERSPEPVDRSDPEPRSSSPPDSTAVPEPLAEPARRGESQVNSRDADPGVAETLWELGHLVTYVLLRALSGLRYGVRLAYARVTGQSKPVDRLAPLSIGGNPDRSASTRFAIRVLIVLLAVIGGLVVFAVAGL
ncbi:DUF87 domain-containing protein [Halodesulfurarchaeum sp. HSR-GB]|uniref:helicase HerA domain-containing protein n=1 Tax=Halodesulfurarchaeum sp. HSR-GB TaxID=3074077 RepID=UPI00285AA1D6|nr:DUF87 domain-containing protein [Halodesulfurarchaeum sp. HSR-GB]MDR5656709.1 DUF87 domain-containing protein [Halodesulfurarchaeum sp. HSR-GB]